MTCVRLRSCVAASICSLLSFLAGCSPAVRTSQIAVSTAASIVRDNFVSTGRLSDATRQELRMTGLEDDPCSDGCYSRMHTFEGEPPVVTLYAQSELALAHAAHLAKNNEPADRARLEAARYALTGILRPECDTPVSFICDDFKIFYMSATVGLLPSLKAANWDGSKLEQLGDFNVVVPAAKDDDDPRIYDSVRPAGLISFEGLANRMLRYGLGVPLSACRPKDPNRPEDSYLPRVGTCLPMTAVLDFPESSGTAVLTLHNAFSTDTVTVSGRTFPLAANFSAPFASLLEKTGLTGFSGLFGAFEGSEELLERTGFFTFQPYSPDKIPLVFVHGLFSSPITWVGLNNDLMGDPIIRKHYQIYSYLYPTNLPIMINAKTFREKLDELKSKVIANAPSSQKAKGQGMVIIAHSMGGLLTKTAVVSDSEPVRQYLWSSPEKLEELDPEIRNSIDDLFTFRRRPYVERVIFVAVPFGGSTIADNWIGWLGRKLIRLPKTVLQTTTAVAKKAKDLVRPELRGDFEGQDFTSVKVLSPHNPVLKGLAQALVDRCVPFHLIEGDQGLGGGRDASDGVVPFTSSHLSGAESELTVPAGHSAFTHPLAIREIERILHEHLRRESPPAQACG